MTATPSGTHAGPLDSRAARLFVVLAAFLACNAMIAEFVGVKIFALEPTLGLDSFDWNLFGQSGSLSFTSGVLLWPFVFLMTDIINEFYGQKGARFVTLIDALYARLPAAEFRRHVRIHPNVSELLPTVLEDLEPM